MSLRRRIAAAVPQIARRDDALARQRERLAAQGAELEELRAHLATRSTTVSSQSRHIRSLVAQLEERGQQLRDRSKECDDLRRQTERLVDIDDYLAAPSFRRQLITLRRTAAQLRDLDPQYQHPLRQIPFKLRNYRLAASHGVATPAVFAAWKDPAQIDLDILPQEFVLKSDGGAGSRGVLPLRSDREGGWVTVDGVARFTAEEVRQRFSDLLRDRKVTRPFFAEELLVQPGSGPLPDDIKVYACYGEVQHVLLRRVAEHGPGGRHVRRYLGPDGSGLGQVVAGVPVDESVPVPARLAEIVGVASHLSRAVGLPFVRVDVYDTDRGIVLGEITRTPGGEQRIRSDHDARMGQAWERASYRLDMDLLAGRPPGVLHGEHDAPSRYHDGHVSHAPRTTSWTPRIVPCGRWC